MKAWEPRDVVVLLLVAALVINPLATLMMVWALGRPITEAGTAAIEQILIAIIAVVAGYVAGKGDKV